MAKYSKYEKKEVTQQHKIHPAWRGIGFLMMVLTPIISWAAADVLIPIVKESESKEFKALVRGLDGRVRFDAGLYQIPGIGGLFTWLSSIDDLQIKLVFTFMFILVLSGILSIVYASIYRVIGPPRYGPLDEPAPKIRAKRYKR